MNLASYDQINSIQHLFRNETFSVENYDVGTVPNVNFIREYKNVDRKRLNQ